MIIQRQSNTIYAIIAGLIYIFAGSAVIFIQGITMNVFIQFLGGILIFTGITGLISSMAISQNSTSFLAVPSGITSLIFGAVFLMFPAFVAGIIIFFLSFILIIVGISFLGAQFGGNKFFKFSWVGVILSVIAVLAGIYMLVNRTGSEQTIMKIIGGLIIIYGIWKIFGSIIKRKNLKRTPEEPDTIDTEYEEVE